MVWATDRSTDLTDYLLYVHIVKEKKEEEKKQLHLSVRSESISDTR